MTCVVCKTSLCLSLVYAEYYTNTLVDVLPSKCQFLIKIYMHAEEIYEYAYIVPQSVNYRQSVINDMSRTVGCGSCK